MDEKEKTAHRREMLVRLVNEKKLCGDVRITVTYLDSETEAETLQSQRNPSRS